MFMTFLVNFTIGNAQRLNIPENYVLIDSISGDLDNDGISELVVAYNTKPQLDYHENIQRELIIYKLKNSEWVVWKSSLQALYGSTEGGMMGDPFGEIKIENGILTITHQGGSSWKWYVIDKYRYQNEDFYLIGYTSNYGKPCEYFSTVDFNLSTGKLLYKKEFEKCEGENETSKNELETFFEKGIKITLQERNATDVIIVTPKYKHTITVARKSD